MTIERRQTSATVRRQQCGHGDSELTITVYPVTLDRVPWVGIEEGTEVKVTIDWWREDENY